jgi:hypothetical protein
VSVDVVGHVDGFDGDFGRQCQSMPSSSEIVRS